MATFTVTSILDPIGAPPGTLRWAINQANMANTDDEIIFDPTVFNNPTNAINLGLGFLGIDDNAGTLTIRGNDTNSVVIDGSAASTVFRIDNAGGGESITFEKLTIRNGNSGGSGGGILHNGNGTVTLRDSTVTGNTAGVGGGIYSNSGDINLINSTISGNVANGDGGGVRSTGGTISNSTITNNTAGAAGAGNGGGIYSPNSITVNNTIIVGNVDNNGVSNPNVTGTFVSNGSNILGDPAGSGNFPADTVNIAAADVIGALADNGGPTQTHALVPGSIAIDSAGTGATTTDQRGFAASGTRDVGAFEFIPPASATTNTTTTTPAPAPFSILNGTPIALFTTVLESSEGRFFIGNNSGRNLSVSSIDFGNAASQFTADPTSANFDPNDGVTFVIRTAPDLAPGFYSTTVSIINSQTETPITFDLTATVTLPTAFDVAPAIGATLPSATPIWTSGDDTLKGADIDGDGKQWLNGSLGNDLIFGNLDQDVLTGGPGQDSLYGGRGDDWLRGADDDDFLAGDFGNDTLIGGAGSDRILIGAGRGSDFLLDFEDGIDQFVLEAPLTTDQLTFQGSGNSTQIKLGDEVLITVIGVAPDRVDASDFTTLT